MGANKPLVEDECTAEDDKMLWVYNSSTLLWRFAHNNALCLDVLSGTRELGVYWCHGAPPVASRPIFSWIVVTHWMHRRIESAVSRKEDRL